VVQKVVMGTMAIVGVHLQHLKGQEGLSLHISKVVPVKLRCYNFPLDSYLYSHTQPRTAFHSPAQPSAVDTQSAEPYSYSSTCTI